VNQAVPGSPGNPDIPAGPGIPERPGGRPRYGTVFGAIAGLLTAAVALGVGQLVSGLGARQGSPAVAVGQAAIDLAPPPVKDFAISAFGSNDKTALVIGILVLLAVFAAVIGVAAMRRLSYGYAGLVIFAAVGMAAALTRPDATFAYAVPTIVGAAVGAFTLNRLIHAAVAATGPPRYPARAAPPPGAAQTDRYAGFDALPSSPGPGSGPATGPASTTPITPPPPPPARPGSAGPGGSPEVPAGPSPEPATSGAGPHGTPERPDAGPVPGRRSVPDTWTYRPPAGRSRRHFLLVSGAAAGGAAVAAFAGRELNARQSVTQARATLRLPAPAEPAPPLPAGTDLHIPGLSSFITPNSTFYRVDTAIVLPEVDPQKWQLHIHGMVDREITISFAELLRKPLIEHYVTLTCVSNPVSGPYIGNARWLGASLASIIREARPQAGATQLLCTSVDGFTSGTPLQAVLDGPDALLAIAMNGTALPVEHGFPARMVVPGLYGYVSATKWVTDINVTTFGAQGAYWTQRGWSQQAPIKTESRIDVPLSGGTIGPGRTAVAGVAWAQHKGIDAVEVRVDQGPWHEATLAAVPGIDTWRQWVWYWDATPGNHVIEARATDDTGYTQTAAQAPPPPNGATGYPSSTAAVRS
jgi:DMSO/TMAO reductase YedYZ molybdopterin-dependent catalytic subunit